MTDHYEHNIDDHEDPAASSTWLVVIVIELRNQLTESALNSFFRF